MIEIDNDLEHGNDHLQDQDHGIIKKYLSSR